MSSYPPHDEVSPLEGARRLQAQINVRTEKQTGETDENLGSQKQSILRKWKSKKRGDQMNIIRQDGSQNMGGNEATANSDETQVDSYHEKTDMSKSEQGSSHRMDDKIDTGFKGGLRFGTQYADKEIISKFDGLNNKIQTCASKFSNASYVTFNHVEKRTLDQFFKVVPNERSTIEALTDLLTSSKRKRRFIQGWIGLVLVEDIFQHFTDDVRPGSNGQDFWMGEYNAQAIRTLERAFLFADRNYVSLEDYNNWRAFSFALMSDVERSQTSRSRPRPQTRSEGYKYSLGKIREIVRQIVDIVKPWLAQGEQDQLRELESALIDIMTVAMDLSRLLRHQRACWSVYYPLPLSSSKRASSYAEAAPLQVMDPRTMEQVGKADARPDFESKTTQGKERQVLELFVTPALFKRGNMEGELYDDNSCRVKATVTCIEPGQKPADEIGGDSADTRNQVETYECQVPSP